MSKLKILFKTTFVITCAYVITSCATQQQLSVADTQSVRKIAILSELDSHMNKVMVGTTMFNSESVNSSTGTWNINHSIENDLAQKLWSKGTEVVVLPTSTADIMQDKQKILVNHSSYKGAQLVLIVKPISQREEYPLFPKGYGVLEKSTLGVKQRLLYASIIYEVYSTKDGSRKAYYVVHPEGYDVVKLDREVSFDQLTEVKMLAYKPQLYTLFDQTNTRALKSLGLY